MKFTDLKKCQSGMGSISSDSSECAIAYCSSRYTLCILIFFVCLVLICFEKHLQNNSGYNFYFLLFFLRVFLLYLKNSNLP